MTGFEKAITDHAPAKKESSLEETTTTWLWAVVIITFVAILGSPVVLKCERFAVGGAVICTKQTRLFWIIPLPETTVPGVQGARLTSIPGDEYCDPCYRVELETAQGIVPLKDAYINGSSYMDTVVEKVNHFVRTDEPGILEVTEPGLLNVQNLFCFVGWFFVAYIWEKIKPTSGRTRAS